MKRTVLIGLACLIMLPAMDKARCRAAPKVPAFPGAEGFGAFSRGGRHGRIVFVTILVDFVNNVVYNFGVSAGHTHPKTNHQVDMNFVGNWYIMGPNSDKIPSLVHHVDTRVYAKGNIGPVRTSPDMDEYAGVQWRGPRERAGLRAEKRFDVAPPVTTHSYGEAYDLILENAGASLPKRDAVDRRLVKEVAERGGRIIDHPKDVGGWPPLESAEPPVDDDRDGMPDAWEREHKLDPADPRDHREDADDDGYTNIEEWLNGTNPRVSQ